MAVATRIVHQGLYTSGEKQPGHLEDVHPVIKLHYPFML